MSHEIAEALTRQSVLTCPSVVVPPATMVQAMVNLEEIWITPLHYKQDAEPDQDEESRYAKRQN